MTEATPSHAPALTTTNVSAAPSRPLLADLVDLCKPRMNFLVLLTTLVGFYMAFEGAFDWLRLGSTLLGTALTAAGASVFNQVVERKHDATMPRTRNRPLASGRVAPRVAWTQATALSLLGVGWLFFLVNPLTAALGAATLLLYVLVYTPLKRVSVLNTWVGTVPGAIPPVMGVAAASGTLTAEAGVLFAILVCWQIPHFLAIAVMYRDDYAVGGYRMLPAVESTALRATAFLSIVFAIASGVAAAALYFVDSAGVVYFTLSLVLSAYFVVMTVRAARSARPADYRKVFLYSIIYLPLLLGAMVLDRVG